MKVSAVSPEAGSARECSPTDTTRKLNIVNVFRFNVIFKICGLFFSVDPLANSALDISTRYSFNHTLQVILLLAVQGKF